MSWGSYEALQMHDSCGSGCAEALILENIFTWGHSLLNIQLFKNLEQRRRSNVLKDSHTGSIDCYFTNPLNEPVTAMGSSFSLEGSSYSLSERKREHRRSHPQPRNQTHSRVRNKNIRHSSSSGSDLDFRNAKSHSRTQQKYSDLHDSNDSFQGKYQRRRPHGRNSHKHRESLDSGRFTFWGAATTFPPASPKVVSQPSRKKHKKRTTTDRRQLDYDAPRRPSPIVVSPPPSSHYLPTKRKGMFNLHSIQRESSQETLTTISDVDDGKDFHYVPHRRPRPQHGFLDEMSGSPAAYR